MQAAVIADRHDRRVLGVDSQAAVSRAAVLEHVGDPLPHHLGADGLGAGVGSFGDVTAELYSETLA